MLLQDFSRAWGDGLSPVASSSLQVGCLSNTTKQFLEEVGLPQEAKPNLTFYSSPDVMAPLPSVLDEVDLPPDFQRYLLLADDGGTFLCIDAKNNEHIVSVDAYQELPTRFVNSAVPEFAECLLAYRALPVPEQTKTVDKQTLKHRLDQLKEQFDKIDVAALNDPDNWWAVVIEELEIFTR